MAMDIILLVIAAVLMLLGIAGSILPLLPGPPLCYVGLLIAQLTTPVQFSVQFLVLWLAIVIVVALLDYYIPIWGTKKFGGSRLGIAGSTIGLLVGMFVFPPWGIILGPMVGAFIGELINNNQDTDKALRSALGAFAGFMLSTGLKLITCFVMAFYLGKAIVSAYIS